MPIRYATLKIHVGFSNVDGVSHATTDQLDEFLDLMGDLFTKQMSTALEIKFPNLTPEVSYEF